MTSTLAQKRDLGTKKAETMGTDMDGRVWGSDQASGKEKQKQMKRDSHEWNNKQLTARKDVEHEGCSELV